jgi:hypothetical protein
MQYRITDYETTTVQKNTRIVEYHPFDIIVVADDVNVLNENARAIQHEGDTYFANSDLNAWELKYCLDNDTSIFAWADATNGKGVIYYMKDEWNNECPYDFKNIQFARWKLYGPKGYRNDYDNGDNWVKVEETPFDSSKEGFYGLNDTAHVFYYGNYKVEYTISGSPTYCYTFGQGTDYSLKGSNYGNVIKEYIYNNQKKIQLNNIVFLSDLCSYNSFGYDCYDISFGENCDNNVFGENCLNNSFGKGCSSNSFGYNCQSNIFSNYCSYNNFRNYCCHNKFGENCDNNVFGYNCDSNIFGNDCSCNSFGDNCGSNSFGNYCSYNNFGYNCEGNVFGKSYYLNSYYRYIIFDNGNRYIQLNCTSTTSNFKYFQNVRIGLGVNNTMGTKTINDSNVGQTYQTLYKPTDSKELTA